MLARRLINQQSTSMDAEEFMVTKLKVFSTEFRKRNDESTCLYLANLRI